MSTNVTTYSMILCTLMTQKRDKKGATQQEFLHEAGIATGTWSRIMRGQAHFQIEDIRSACRYLQCTIGELTKEADEMQDKLQRKEDVKVVSKDDLKPNQINGGALVAGAALAFLLIRLSDS